MPLNSHRLTDYQMVLWEPYSFKRSLKIRLESENILKKSIDTENSLIYSKHKSAMT
ncbi:cathepsin L-like cysteine proteinase A [Escherichia phage NJ01]|uniref:Cathepsin L-like cysteine proteinase A n=1 Tax=Escherichia phage NJ01 TaxID=1237159 RepID=K4I3Q6_9CAUD|nr:cathepsin L-like cysteine proteinase A [Escherichia phage NJ01]AFU62470.1 cathepsin L-like cysteine proteinase A [Escherichia phage NJ01]